MKGFTSLFANIGLFAFNASANQCSIDALNGVLPAHASILSAVSVSSNGTYGQGAADIAYPTNPTNLPALCAITANVTSSPSSSFRFGLFLPAQWNSRFLAVGNGGFAGGINWLDMGTGAQYGFAVMSTDTGHNSTTSDVSWALDRTEQKIDFGYRAMHGSVVLAKKIAERFYSKDIEYSYYSGCSTGGRQGLKEAELFPEDFDGIMAGAPAWWTSHLQPWTVKVGAFNLPVNDSKHIPSSLFPAIAAEVMKQCDSVDGVEDGIVSASDRCNFNYEALLCGSGALNSSSCLTPQQVDTARKIHGDYYANGRFVMSGLRLGSEVQWPVLLGGTEPNPLGTEYVQYFLLDDADWPWQSYNDSIVALADELNPGNTTADDYDLSAFKARGGKLIMYHGEADALIPTGSSNAFYEQVSKAMGAQNVDDFFRFFLVPGMQHCSGTVVDAPWYFAGANQAGALGTGLHSVPGFEDGKHDALIALMNWVETGKALNEIIATTWKNSTVPSSGVLKQRPLCPFPKSAVWDGEGDIDQAESWTCE